MKLTPEQLEELRAFVNDDDQHAFQELVDIIVRQLVRQRERERKAKEAENRPIRSWIPQQE